MKSGIIIVFVAVTAFAYAIPAIEDAKGGSDYFKKKLHEIQGAIDDTIKAGMDLEDMEDRLQDIVNQSSFFFRTESATEYATNKNAYANGWTGPVDTDCYIDGDLKSYEGKTAKTQNGLDCLHWSSEKAKKFYERNIGQLKDEDFPDASVDKAMNYCRVPDDYTELWCLVEDKYGIRYGYCNVPKCPDQEN